MNEQPVSTSLRARIVIAIGLRGVSLALMLVFLMGLLHLYGKIEHGSVVVFAVVLQTAAVIAALARQRVSWMLWLAGIALFAVGRFETLPSIITTLFSLPAAVGWWPRSASGEVVVAAYRSMLTKLFVGATLLLWLPLLGFAAHAFEGAASTLAPLLALGCVVLTLVACIATLLKRAAAYTLWLSVTAGSLLTFGFAIAVNELNIASNMVIMVGWVGGILAAVGALDVDRERRPSRLIMGAALALTLVSSTMMLLADDLRAFRDDIRRARWEEQCNGGVGSAHACGYWALYTVHHPDAAADLDGALQRFQDLCDRTHSRGCGLASLMLKDHGWAVYEEPQPKWFERRNATAIAACDDGLPTACLVEAVVLRGELRDGVLDGLRKACLAGDLPSCRAETMDRLGEVEGKKELCEQGFLTECLDAPCTRNNLASCKYDYEAEPWNTLFYRVKVPADGLEAACEGGEAEACFALGLNVTADVEFHEPVPVRSLEATWGRACELGFNMACTTFALRLLDRPLEAKRDEARARALLQTACDRGDAGACWTIEVAFARVPPREQLADLTAKAWAACQQTNEGCYTHIALRAVELEVDPYPVLPPFAVSLAEKACGYGRSYYCDVASRLYEDSTSDALPFVVRRFDNATLGCKMGNTRSCRQLFHLAAMMQGLGSGTPEHYRVQICPQVPDACD